MEVAEACGSCQDEIVCLVEIMKCEEKIFIVKKKNNSERKKKFLLCVSECVRVCVLTS